MATVFIFCKKIPSFLFERCAYRDVWSGTSSLTFYNSFFAFKNNKLFISVEFRYNKKYVRRFRYTVNFPQVSCAENRFTVAFPMIFK